MVALHLAANIQYCCNFAGYHNVCAKLQNNNYWPILRKYLLLTLYWLAIGDAFQSTVQKTNTYCMHSIGYA